MNRKEKERKDEDSLLKNNKNFNVLTLLRLSTILSRK